MYAISIQFLPFWVIQPLCALPTAFLKATGDNDLLHIHMLQCTYGCLCITNNPRPYLTLWCWDRAPG